MKTIPSLCLAAAMACTVAPFLTAQNTILPPPLHTTYPVFTWDSTVFSDGIPAFALGHQWGASSLDKVNSIFSMNMTSDHFGYMWDDSGKIKRDTTTGVLLSHLNQLYHLGQGYRDTNYIIIGSAIEGMTANHDFNGRWIGMRWEPAENAGYDATWTPCDSLSWPFSFAVRRHGTIPSSQADVNYRRYVVVPEAGATYPVKVLDSAELCNGLCMRDVKVDWADDPIGSASRPHPQDWCFRLKPEERLGAATNADSAAYNKRNYDTPPCNKTCCFDIWVKGAEAYVYVMKDHCC